MARLLALIQKEIIQVLRDPISLMIMFVLPGFMLILFGVAVSLDVDRIRLAVLDLDRTPGSREFVRRLTESGYFHIVAYVSNDREIRRLVDAGEASVAVKIPPDFERNLKALRPSPVRIVVDGSDSNTATITLSYVNLIIQQYSTERLLEGFARLGIQTERVGLPAELEPRILYNPELVSENFFVPGLIAMVMMVSTAVLTAMSIVREKERGTIEMLMVSPISRAELVLGKIFPYFVIAFINLLILVILSGVLFGVPFRGSPILLFALSALFLLTALGIGVFISTLASSQQVAWTVCLLTTALPSFLLSGFIFPIESMPWGIRLFTYAVPVRYFIVIVRGIVLKGVGADSLAFQIMSLALFAFVIVTASSLRIARRLK
ncbi:MAG: ABC transporter permease [Candidatus Hydrogenedentota bacterium]|nr:MAG: ABC transporter permease [Candidatus Hydrogenedentota bacterium]